MSRGLGAWSFGFYEYNMPVPNDRVIFGIFAFKHALIDNGYASGIKPDLPIFGSSARDRTIDFQNAKGLTKAAGYTPGRIGSTVARLLFRHYAYAAEAAEGVPDHLAQRLGTHECSQDPVAQGFYDDQDEGWGQYHLPYHPELTIEMAWTPSLIIPKVAHDLRANFNGLHDWDGAVAAHNIGVPLAASWVAAGKPSSGGPIIYGQDAWVRATGYVAAIKVMPV